MLYNTEVSFALKNTFGKYDIKEFSLFEIEKLSKSLPQLDVKLIRNKEVSFKIECPLCGEEHRYSYGINEFLKRDMVIGGCEVLGVPLFYIGNKTNILQRISKINEINKNVLAMI